jgi:hypothetical protein
MHEDHLRGLSGSPTDGNKFEISPNLAWDYGQIYCTTITYRMMLLRFPNLKEFMVPLELNKEHVLVENYVHSSKRKG